jgi:CRISPR/Cas system-associated exonuclease Cas4 (RecB family)
MIRKLKAHEIRPLNHVSPSQYYSALSCPYKLVLANSFGNEPLLPMNANGHFGSITHKMIELISRGIITDEKSFSENWSNLISEKENELKSKGESNIVPLKYFVTNFALKKNQLRNILCRKKKKIDYLQKAATTNYYAEKKLSNSDKSIIGVADLILKNDTGITIMDFKTGKIYSESIDECGNTERIIKKEYEFQLKLYAHLYFLMNQEYPTALFLVTLENDFVEVPFTKEDCESIYMDAIVFLSSTNTFIRKGEFESIAKPSEENCKYCSFRPACTFYSRWLTTNFQQVNDLTGILKSITVFNNDSLGVQLQVNDKDVLINGLSSNLKEAFENLLTKNVTLYNLKKTKQSFNATANNFTIVYE